MAKKTRAGLLGLASATIVAGSVILTAAPASAIVTPHVKVETFRAYNYPDSYGQVQHYDKIGSGFKLGGWAPKGKWSEQTACWAGRDLVPLQLQGVVGRPLTLRNSVSSVAIAIALAAGLVSCSSISLGADVRATKPAGSTFDGPIPDFSGPYAAEFAEAYRSTTDELVHEILAKESITDQDYAIVSGRFVKCMANKGFRVQIDGPAGQMTMFDLPTDEDGDRANAANLDCGSDSGYIELCALRNSILRNPENLDENTIMAACAVRQKIAPPSYTAKDYARDIENWSFPFSTSSMEFGRCIDDPLGQSLTR